MRSIKSFIGFLCTVLLFLYLANFVVYEGILLALGIFTTSWTIMGLLAFLGLSFIVSTILGMKYYNYFTRAYYALSMAWMGFFGYLFLASFVYIVKFPYLGSYSTAYAVFIFSIPVILGVYGLVHARNIIVKKIKVTLPNLPKFWKNKKALWVSDLHIGQIHGKNYVQKVVNKIKEAKPDIVFIGGDLFDGSSAEGILKSIAPFRELLNIPLGIYFVMGNHESYGNVELFSKAIIDSGIHILNNENKVIDGLQIIGVNYDSTTTEEGFKKALSNILIDRNVPSILLKHEPRFVNVSEESGISLQISGHTHKAQQWPYQYLARLAYGKFTYGLQRFKEMQVFTSSGVGTWGPPMRVGSDSEVILFELE